MFDDLLAAGYAWLVLQALAGLFATTPEMPPTRRSFDGAVSAGPR